MGMISHAKKKLPRLEAKDWKWVAFHFSREKKFSHIISEDGAFFPPPMHHEFPHRLGE